MSTHTAPASLGTPEKQITLPFSKAWEISMKSIKIRLGRSLITASGIMLGIAFFSSVRTVVLFPITQTGAAAEAARSRHSFLAIMALLVCFVGIMNSMLMSVTERFREIGTMKCLGALDQFIVTLFIIEAGIMGLFSAMIGWFLGWLIMVIPHMFGGGAHDLNRAFFGGSLAQAAQSVAIGLVITLIACIPTARSAAKMPPAAALRSEI